jgi:hypothetical protein
MCRIGTAGREDGTASMIGGAGRVGGERTDGEDNAVAEVSAGTESAFRLDRGSPWVRACSSFRRNYSASSHKRVAALLRMNNPAASSGVSRKNRVDATPQAAGNQTRRD